jgi:cobalt-zinc-cadmium efflux system membrane fusion protein
MQNRQILFLEAALMVLAAHSIACNKATSSPVPAAQTPKTDANPMDIRTAAELLSQLKIGEPQWAEVGTSQTVPARIEVDDRGTTRVGSSMMGRISSLYVHEGEMVKRGQLLAILNSPGLSDSQLVLLKALSQRQLAQRALERAQLLLKADVIGTAELQRREAEVAQATLDIDAARNQLEVLGMTPEGIAELEKTRAINSVSRILATSDGVVLEHNIRLGQVIQPADTVFEIADLSTVWLVADVPEQDAGELQTGLTVDGEVSAFPGSPIHGTLTFVSATVNPETRTIRARMNVSNLAGRYKPAMLATMTVRARAERRQLIPASAVVREDDRPHIFVQTSDETFQLRPVSLGDEHGNRRVLLDGVRGGEKIVLDGAFHLNNERLRRLLRATEGQ